MKRKIEVAKIVYYGHPRLKAIVDEHFDLIEKQLNEDQKKELAEMRSRFENHLSVGGHHRR